MDYPTMAEVEEADHRRLALWFRFLPSPGWDIQKKRVGSDIKMADEKTVLDRVIERFDAGGGMTPELSKEIGWDEPDE